MIMLFRPANISLITRRHSLPRLLLTLSSIGKNDQRILTGHYISIDERAVDGWAVIGSEFERVSCIARQCFAYAPDSDDL
jgi:hypothetical protein